jgi:hypothetical protein
MNCHTVDVRSQRIFSLLCDVERGGSPALTPEERSELVYMQRRISWAKARMEAKAAKVEVVVVPRRERARMMTGWELLVRRVVGIFDEITNRLVFSGNGHVRIRLHPERQSDAGRT